MSLTVPSGSTLPETGAADVAALAAAAGFLVVSGGVMLLGRRLRRKQGTS